jgi:phosphatidylinositol alpha-mannosyltransferase
MRVCLTIDSNLTIPGGVQTYVRGLYEALKKRGHEVTIFAAGRIPPEDEGRELISLGKLVELPLGGDASLPLIAANPFRVYLELRRRGFEIVHIPGHGGMLSWWVVFLSPAPVVASFLSFSELVNKRLVHLLFAPFFRLLNRRLNARIAISQTSADYGNRSYPGEYEIIPAGVDLSRFYPGRKKSGWANSKVEILFVGRLDPRKGIMDLLEAVRRLRSERDARAEKVKVVVVGDGPERKKAERFVRKHAFEGVVEFAGRVADEDLPGYFREADIFCSPAKWEESFGIVLLEAMASGLPVVAYGNAGYREVLGGRLAEMVVKPGDVEGLAGKLGELVEDKRRREEMGRLGREMAQEYAWERVAARLEERYREVVGAV